MKRLIALLLVLVMCVALLASCGRQPVTALCDHVDENGDKKCDECKNPMPLTYFETKNYVSTSADSALSGVKSFEVKGNLGSYTDKLFTTTETSVERVVPADAAAGIPEKKFYDTVYRVYNQLSGAVVYEKTVVNASKVTAPSQLTNANYDQTITDDTVRGVFFLLNDTSGALDTIQLSTMKDCFFVATYTEGDMYTLELRKLDGTVIVPETLTEIQLGGWEYNYYTQAIDDKTFVFGSKIYSWDGTTATAVVDYKEACMSLSTASSLLKNKIGDKYYDLNTSATVASLTIYDSAFKVVNYYEFVDTSASGYTSYQYYLMGNGNVFVRKMTQKAVQDLLPDDKYDIIVGINTGYGIADYASSFEYSIFDTTTGKYSEIEKLPFSQLTVEAVEIANAKNPYDYKDIGKTVICGYVYDENGVVNEVTRYFVLNDDGTVGQELYGKFEGAYYSNISYSVYSKNNDYYIVNFKFGAFLYKNDGTKIGQIPGGASTLTGTQCNSKFFVYNGALYAIDTLTKVFDIPANAQNGQLLFDSYYYTVTEEKDPTKEDSKEYKVHYLYTAGAAATELLRDEQGDNITYYVVVTNKGIAVQKSVSNAATDTVPATTDSTYTLYASNGTSLASLERKDIYGAVAAASAEATAYTSYSFTVVSQTNGFLVRETVTTYNKTDYSSTKTVFYHAAR